MYCTAEQTSDFSNTDAECKRLLAEVTSRIHPVARDVLIPASDPVDTRGSFYLLKDGMALFQRDDQILLYLEEGDAVGLHDFSVLMPARAVFPLGVRVDQFDRKRFIQQIAKDELLQEKWDRFVSKQLTLYLSIITALHRDLAAVDPVVHSYEPGQMIMEAGSEPGLVFTLVQGAATVKVGEKNMGEVEHSRIFGAYSAVTGTPRQASVIATTPCLAMTVTRSAFLSMLRFQSLEFIQVYSQGRQTVII